MTMTRSEDFAASPAAPATAVPFVVPPTVVGLLTQTRPWVKLVSVLAFLGCGLGGLGIILVLVLRPFARGERLLLLVPGSLIGRAGEPEEVLEVRGHHRGIDHERLRPRDRHPRAHRLHRRRHPQPLTVL
jgi:hypothetical protein